MANLPETPVWETGIYQLEETDPVQGGPNGIDNQQGKQLANRTAWLKEQVETLGNGKQPLDATLTALASLETVADRLIYSTGPDAFAVTPLSAFIRTLLDDSDASSARATIGAISQAQLDVAIAALVNSSPATLDTLNELASALGNDANFATTVSNALALKASIQSVQKSESIVSVAGGGADAITATYTPAIAALSNGMTLYVRAGSANATATPTFSPNSGTIAAKTIVKGSGQALVAGDIAGGGHWIELQYDQPLDKWVLLNPATGITNLQAGEITFFARNTAPTGYLKANGAAISRTTYSALFAAIGTTFGIGDGSTTFNLPDLRGEFLRGWDDSRGVDSGRTFGSAQAAAVESHTHNVKTSTTGAGGSAGDFVNGGGGNVIPTTAYGGSETRPRNVAMLACIKY
jgi:phage-related tail fiber protein